MLNPLSLGLALATGYLASKKLKRNTNPEIKKSEKKPEKQPEPKEEPEKFKSIEEKKAEILRIENAITDLSQDVPGNRKALQSLLRTAQKKGLSNLIDQTKYTGALNALKQLNDTVPQLPGQPPALRGKDPFIHNNLVPFLKGNSTQNVSGTGIRSGNYQAVQDGSPTQRFLNTYSGVNNIDWKSKATRQEGQLFSPDERGPQNVFGNPVQRMDVERLIDPLAKRHDLKPTESVKVGPGIGTSPDLAAGTDGFHWGMWRPDRDNYNAINATYKEATEAPDPRGGRHQTLTKGPTDFTYSGGLGNPKGTMDSKETFAAEEQTGAAFVNKRINTYVTDSNRTPMPDQAPKQAHPLETDYLDRKEPNREQEPPYTGNERGPYPKSMWGQRESREGQKNNVALSRKALDRDKNFRPEHGSRSTLIAKRDPWVAHQTQRGQSVPIANYRNPYSGSTVAPNNDLKGTQRGNENTVLPGSQPAKGYKQDLQDSARTTMRETTNFAYEGNPANRADRHKMRYEEDSQRNNKRALLLPEGRPVVEGNKTLSDIKTRVGEYKVRTTLREDYRTMHETKSFVTDRNIPESTVRDTKLLEAKNDSGYNRVRNMSAVTDVKPSLGDDTRAPFITMGPRV